MKSGKPNDRNVSIFNLTVSHQKKTQSEILVQAKLIANISAFKTDFNSFKTILLIFVHIIPLAEFFLNRYFRFWFVVVRFVSSEGRNATIVSGYTACIFFHVYAHRAPRNNAHSDPDVRTVCAYRCICAPLIRYQWGGGGGKNCRSKYSPH